MARKNLLKGLMEAPQEARKDIPQEIPALETKAAGPGRPKIGAKTGVKSPLKGAIGAVGQQIADLKSRAVLDIDPSLVHDAGLADRLDRDTADDAALAHSIAEHGQQVPALVRPHPDRPGQYQIVYGRRRVRAARALGVALKAMVRTLDDQALVLAQGQENTARRDLSFIERAHFAQQMAAAGYPRKVIAEALSIGKSEISRLLSVIERIPDPVLHAIGAAPSVGRARWLAFADLMERKGYTAQEVVVLVQGETSDARFEALIKAMSLAERRASDARKAAKPARQTLAADDGRALGHVRIMPDKVALELDRSDGFARWLVTQLPDLHKRWQQDN